MHTWARILRSLQFYFVPFYTLQVYTILMLYLLFCVMMMLLLFYLYICNYVIYRRPQGRIAY